MAAEGAVKRDESRWKVFIVMLKIIFSSQGLNFKNGDIRKLWVFCVPQQRTHYNQEEPGIDPVTARPTERTASLLLNVGSVRMFVERFLMLGTKTQKFITDLADLLLDQLLLVISLS